MRQLTGAVITVAAACAVTAVVLASVTAAGHSAPPVTEKTKPTPGAAGPPPVSAAPYYVVVNGALGTATVRRTATGAKIEAVRRPRGATFIGVAAAGDDRTFVLAAQTSSTSDFYRLRLSGHGTPGRLVALAVPPLPGRLGSCLAQLAGLAVSPDGRLLAISLLSNCPTGDSGPSEILIVALGSGRTLAKFHPGDGYPMSLSLSTTGTLAYSWTSTQIGVSIIPDATEPDASPRSLISGSASVSGFNGAGSPLITPDGSAVIVTVGRGSLTLALAEFSVRGTARRLLTPPVRDPAQYCGPLWTDASGRGILAGCGDNSEYQIRGRQLTRLRKPWQLPAYNTPTPPLIAW
jgi:hypothetical protein